MLNHCTCLHGKNWISHKNVIQCKPVSCKSNNEGTYELCASGRVVIQGVVKQEKCAHDLRFICPLSTSSNEEKECDFSKWYHLLLRCESQRLLFRESQAGPKVVLTNHWKPNLQTEIMPFFTCVDSASEWFMKWLGETLANIDTAIERFRICHSHRLNRRSQWPSGLRQ